MTNETRELGNLSILMDIYQMMRECHRQKPCYYITGFLIS